MSDLLEKTLKKLKISELKGLIKNRKYKIKLTQKKQDLINDICTHVTSPKPKQKTKVKGGMFGMVRKQVNEINLKSPGPIEQKFAVLYGPYMGFMIKIDNCKIIFLGEHHYKALKELNRDVNLMQDEEDIHLSFKYFCKFIIQKYSKCLIIGELNTFPKYHLENLVFKNAERRIDISISGSKKYGLNEALSGVFKPQDNIQDINDKYERVFYYFNQVIMKIIETKNITVEQTEKINDYIDKNEDLQFVLLSIIRKLLNEYKSTPQFILILNKFEALINQDISKLISIQKNNDESINKYYDICTYLTDLESLNLLFQNINLPDKSLKKEEKVIIIYGGAAHIKTFSKIIPQPKLWSGPRMSWDDILEPKNMTNSVLLANDFFDQIEIFDLIKEKLKQGKKFLEKDEEIYLKR